MSWATTALWVATAYQAYAGERARSEKQEQLDKTKKRNDEMLAQQRLDQQGKQAEQDVDIRNEQMQGMASGPQLKTSGQLNQSKGKVKRDTLSPKRSLMIGQSRGYQSGYQKS